MFEVAAVRDVVVPRLELLMANTRLEPIRARILITLKGSPNAFPPCFAATGLKMKVPAALGWADVVEIVDKSTVSDRVLAIVDTCLAIDRSAPTLVRTPLSQRLPPHVAVSLQCLYSKLTRLDCRCVRVCVLGRCAA